jgi:hypothetical protein
MLEQICSRMQSRNLATHEVRLALGNYLRVLNLPLPVRNARLLTRLLILDLEAHPPGAAIRRVELEAVPAKPRVVQNGLFVPLSPEPEKLELTLARLKAVVGEENVGAAEILDTHRPDGIAVRKFQIHERSNVVAGFRAPTPLLKEEGWTRHQERSREATFDGADGVVRPAKSSGLHTFAELTTPSAAFIDASPCRARPSGPQPPLLFQEGSCGPRSLNLRLFRPPREATVQLRNNIPIWIAWHGLHGPIATASGPWRTSGDWWRPTTWDREEWDVEVLDALYRIYYDVHLDRWYAQGVYD